jgi:hypothetical protein
MKHKSIIDFSCKVYNCMLKVIAEVFIVLICTYMTYVINVFEMYLYVFNVFDM